MELDHSYHDFKFFSKRHIVGDLKKYIGQLNHRLEVEWTSGGFEKRSQLCSDISAGVKDTYERLKDLVENVAGLENYAEILMEDEKRRLFLGQNIEKEVPDGLQNQLDTIDAMLVSLSTKIAVMDRINDEQSKSEVYEKSVQDAICACLDALLVLAESFMEAQLFGLVTELHRSSMAHLYFHIQLRTDFVLSQAITIAATAIVDTVYRGWPIFDGGIFNSHFKTSLIGEAGDLLLTISSFLSAYGDERGMAEDAWEAWRQLESRVLFSLVRAPSQVCRTCVPLVSGQRTQINVNHEATLAQSFGGVTFETAINQEGAERMLAYSNRYMVEPSARDAVMELVSSEPSRKNLAIFEWAMTSCELMGGEAVICCKSGKDRTGMAVTLEQGRLLRETCGLNSAQVLLIFDLCYLYLVYLHFGCPSTAKFL
ncbi:unnamed protein product [Strongylus vulgaris]|uniref:Uncharacterized protein n=1 Tax=Strongylus vulgaris TaxID=40348 RepID=A0A3P7I2E8_STRVU|nr:unnamed protein product [Strongylus vulgaris]